MTVTPPSPYVWTRFQYRLALLLATASFLACGALVAVVIWKVLPLQQRQRNLQEHIALLVQAWKKDMNQPVLISPCPIQQKPVCPLCPKTQCPLARPLLAQKVTPSTPPAPQRIDLPKTEESEEDVASRRIRNDTEELAQLRATPICQLPEMEKFTIALSEKELKSRLKKVCARTGTYRDSSIGNKVFDCEGFPFQDQKREVFFVFHLTTHRLESIELSFLQLAYKAPNHLKVLQQSFSDLTSTFGGTKWPTLQIANQQIEQYETLSFGEKVRGIYIESEQDKKSLPRISAPSVRIYRNVYENRDVMNYRCYTNQVQYVQGLEEQIQQDRAFLEKVKPAEAPAEK